MRPEVAQGANLIHDERGMTAPSLALRGAMGVVQMIYEHSRHSALSYSRA